MPYRVQPDRVHRRHERRRTLWNYLILAHGPGDSSLDHTPDEPIEIPDLQRGITVLQAVLRALCG